MLNHQPSSILAFHSCDIEVGLRVLLGIDNLKSSENDWDWLADGIYFWEQNPERALSYAMDCASGKQKNKVAIKTPFVLGCLIDLGNCFNLTETTSIEALKRGYDGFIALSQSQGKPVPQNKDAKRELDCAVIRYIHAVNKAEGFKPYNTVRAAFTEGNPVYESCNIWEQSHIQISVRTEDCIRGYFLPKPISQFNPYLSTYIEDKIPHLDII